MVLIPAISDDFDSPVGQLANWKSLPGEIPPDSSQTISTFIPPTPTNINHLEVNKHIDIRTFRQETQVRDRTMADLDLFHQAQDARVQMITTSSRPDTGDWTLIWYDGLTEEPHSFTFPWNVSEVDVQSALNQFLGSGAASVVSGAVGFPRFPMTITFDAGLGAIWKLGVFSALTSGGSDVTLAVSLFDTTDTNWLQSADVNDPTFTQDQIEHIIINIGEDWSVDPRSPGFINSDASIQPNPTNNYWNELRIALNDAMPPFNVTVVSRSNGTRTDLTKLNGANNQFTFITFGLPSFPSDVVNLPQSYIQITSDPLGRFGDEGGSGQDSAKVYLDSYTTGTTNLTFMASLNVFLGSVNFSRVTGVRLTFVGNGTSATGRAIRIASIRAIDQSWFPMALDEDTVRGVFVKTIPKNGTTLNDNSWFPPILRASDLSSDVSADPEPQDVTLSLKFFTGLLRATSKIQMYLREVEDGTQTRFLVGELQFNDTDVFLRRYKVIRVFQGDSYLDTIQFLDTVQVNGPQIAPGVLAPLLSNTNYLFQQETLGASFRLALYQLDQDGVTVRTHYDTGLLNNPAFAAENGKVGWWANLATGDMNIDYLHSGSLTFSVFRTEIFEQKTPVVGAQLFVDGAQSLQQFNGFTSVAITDEVDQDLTKTSSGKAWKYTSGYLTVTNTISGFRSNTIEIDDWTQTAINFDILVSTSIANDPDKMPAIYFQIPGKLPTLDGAIGPIPLNIVANVWSHVSVDLGFLARQPVGNYEMWVTSLTPPFENWWLDNVSVTSRAVDWQMRAQSGAQWVSFGDMVNDPTKALHLPDTAWGKELQIQASALSPNAWIASYRVIPIHAQLGRLLYKPVTVEDSTVYSNARITGNETFVPNADGGTVTGLAVLGYTDEYFHT